MKEEGRKWRFPYKPPILLDCQHDAFSSESAKNHEQGQNKQPNCKAEFSAFEAVPVGGTTGLCHETSAVIDVAAQWYAANRQACQRPVIPVLKRMFGLSALEAILAIRAADGVRQ